MRHNKTIDIMGNIIDSPPEVRTLLVIITVTADSTLITAVVTIGTAAIYYTSCI